MDEPFVDIGIFGRECPPVGQRHTLGVDSGGPLLLPADEIRGKKMGKKKLNKDLTSDVENIMNLALDWLGAWDVTGEGVNKDPIETRIKAMHKMKDAVFALALKAQNAAGA